MEVLRSPKAVGLQVASGWRSPGRRERMYSGHRTIGLQVTTAWRSPGGHRMRAYMSPQSGDLQVDIACGPTCHHRVEISGMFHPTQAKTQARHSVFCAHSKPWFPGRKKDVVNRDLACSRNTAACKTTTTKKQFYSIYRSSRNVVFSKTVQLIC